MPPIFDAIPDRETQARIEYARLAAAAARDAWLALVPTIPMRDAFAAQPDADDPDGEEAHDAWLEADPSIRTADDQIRSIAWIEKRPDADEYAVWGYDARDNEIEMALVDGDFPVLVFGS
jgi:hypothetical protein